MAYSNYGRGRGNRGGGGFTTRLTGLFPMRNGRGSVGTLRDQDLDELVRVIKEAKADGKSITFFVWEPRDRDGNASLTVAPAQDRDNNRGRSRDRDDDERRPAPRREAPRDRRPIADDPFEDNDADEPKGKDKSDPFGLD